MVTDGVTINRLIVVVILQCIQKLNHYVVQNETSIMFYVNCGGCCLVSRLCLTLCNPLGYSPPGSSVHGISQARILEWGVISSSRGSSWPRDWICVSCFGRRLLYPWASRKSGKEYVKAVDCHPAYLTYMQSTSWEILDWIKHKLESRLLGEISITSDMQMTPPLWQKVKRN